MPLQGSRGSSEQGVWNRVYGASEFSDLTGQASTSNHTILRAEPRAERTKLPCSQCRDEQIGSMNPMHLWRLVGVQQVQQ